MVATAYFFVTNPSPKTFLLVLYLIEGMLFIGLSIPLIRGAVAPNSWYGFRVKRTLENPSVWYAVNRYAAFHLLGLGIAMMISAFALYWIPNVGFVTYALACLTVTLVGLGVLLVRSFRRLRQL